MTTAPLEPLDPARTEFLLRATKVLFSTLDSERTLRTLAEFCTPEVADWCVVHALQDDGRIERVAHASAQPEWLALADEWERRFAAKLDDAVGLGRVIREGTPEFVLDLDPQLLAAHTRGDDHLSFTLKLGVRSAMILPLRIHGRVLGALSLAQTTSGRRFTQADMRFGEELALRAAIALENARLFAGETKARHFAERAHERMKRLQRATARLARVRRPAEIASVLQEAVSDDMGSVSVVIAALAPEGDSLHVASAHGPHVGPHWSEHAVKLDDEVPIAACARTREPVFVGSVEERERRFPAMAAWNPQGTAWAAVPLAHEDHVLGAFGVVYFEPQPFPAADQAYLATLGEQAAQALARIRLEEALLFQKTLLESQNEAALDGIFFQDERGRAAFWNTRLLEMWGVSASIPKMERIEDRLAKTVDLLADPAAFYALAMGLEKEPDKAVETDLKLRDGRIFDCYTAPVKDTDGSYRGRVWFYRDVTRRRLAEEELILARRQLAHSEKLAAIGTLVSGVAHEIRTPLAYAANHAYLLQGALKDLDTDASDNVRESVKAILEATDRINRLVQDLRRFTKLDAPLKADTAVDEATQGAARLFETAHPDRVHLELDVRSRARAAVDRIQLQQVLLNLIENAADASPTHGRVVVRTRATEEMVEIVVEDEGTGIPAETQTLMWEPFFTTKSEGTGLGLSIVRRIVETNDGSVSCESAPAKGSRFTVRFPRRNEGPAQT